MVAVVLFAFLLNVRTTAISLLAIPVSVLTTAVVFHLFGLSINTIRSADWPSPSASSSTTRWWTSRTSNRRLGDNGGKAARKSVFQVVVGGLERGALRHRLRDADHHPGVRAALRPLGHRGPALRPTGARLHHLDPGEPAHLLITLTPVLPPCSCGAEEPGRARQQPPQAAQAGQRRAAAGRVPAPGLLVGTVAVAVISAGIAAWNLPGPSCRRSTRARSRST